MDANNQNNGNDMAASLQQQQQEVLRIQLVQQHEALGAQLRQLRAGADGFRAEAMHPNTSPARREALLQALAVLDGVGN
jgi:hypothetical protein